MLQKKKGSSSADNEALMLLKFTVNHAAVCERDIRANIYKSAVLEEREEQAGICVRSSENKVTKERERDLVSK